MKIFKEMLKGFCVVAIIILVFSLMFWYGEGAAKYRIPTEQLSPTVYKVDERELKQFLKGKDVISIDRTYRSATVIVVLEDETSTTPEEKE
jgi:hypothetical protein